MAFEQIRIDRQLSRLELAIVILLIALCFTWFLHRMNYMAALAEATALDLTVRNLKTGVMTAAAAGILGNRTDAMTRIAEGNPVGRAIEPPPGYIGAVRGAVPGSIHAGQWYFDEDQRWLVYHIVNADYFVNAGEGPARVRIQLQLIYNDVNQNGAFDAGTDQPEGVSVVVLDRPTWRL
jgi:hypothetical protein